MDYQNLSDDQLRSLTAGADLQRRMEAKDELARRKRERTQPPSSGEWWTRTGVIVAIVLGILTIAVTIIATVYLPEIRSTLGLDKPAPGHPTSVAQNATPTGTSETSPGETPVSAADPQDPKSEAPSRSRSAERHRPAINPRAQGRSAAELETTKSPAAAPRIDPIPIGPGGLSRSEAAGIASDSQSLAASILSCLAQYPTVDGTPCAGVYGAQITKIRDRFHNRKIEVQALNQLVQQLESQSSADCLRRSAEALRTIADTINLALQNLKPELEAEAPQKPILLDPIFVGKLGLTDFSANLWASSAQRSAATILACLTEHGDDDGKYCAMVYGTQVVRDRDELHNDGVEFRELNDDAGQIESAPNAAILRRSAEVLREAADKVRELTRRGKEQSGDPIPNTIDVTLPATIHIRKGRIKTISTDARLSASTIEACECVDNRVFNASGDFDTVTAHINLMRGEFERAGFEVAGLEDAAHRIQRGPSKEEIRYIARVLDELSRELDKRTQ